MTTPLAFAAKMNTLATTIPQIEPRSMVAAAEMVSKTIDAGAPKTLRNVGKSGGRIGTKVDPPIKLGERATVRVRATGPYHLIEKSIAAHSIEPKALGAAVDHVLIIPGSDSGFAASANHPGVKRTSGPFERGVKRAAPMVSRVMHEALLAQMRAVI